MTDAVPEYSGFYYLQSDIKPANANFDRLAATAGPGSLLYIGSARQIAAQRLADGTINTYICFRLPEAWSKSDQQHRSDPTEFRRKLLDNQFSDWADEAKDFIRHSEGPLYAWPLYFIPTEHLCWKTVPGVALIGDAAHPMMPTFAQGACMALEDAAALGIVFSEKYYKGDIVEALRLYERVRKPRATKVQAAAARARENIHERIGR